MAEYHADVIKMTEGWAVSTFGKPPSNCRTIYGYLLLCQLLCGLFSNRALDIIDAQETSHNCDLKLTKKKSMFCLPDKQLSIVSAYASKGHKEESLYLIQKLDLMVVRELIKITRMAQHTPVTPGCKQTVCYLATRPFSVLPKTVFEEQQLYRGQFAWKDLRESCIYGKTKGLLCSGLT